VQGTGGCNYHHSENDGGQAIVGNVSHGGEGTAKNGGQPHEPSAADEHGPALLSHEQTVATDMLSDGGSRLGGVSVSRRERRSAKRRG